MKSKSQWVITTGVSLYLLISVAPVASKDNNYQSLHKPINPHWLGQSTPTPNDSKGTRCFNDLKSSAKKVDDIHKVIRKYESSPPSSDGYLIYCLAKAYKQLGNNQKARNLLRVAVGRLNSTGHDKAPEAERTLMTWEGTQTISRPHEPSSITTPLPPPDPAAF
jgi:hypothetical protein